MITTRMWKTALLPATLAALLASLAPASATMTAPFQTPPAAPHATPALSDAALAQLAIDAGVTVEQAKHLTISQLAFLKEQHDS